MDTNITNIATANQRIGELVANLKNEKEARTAAITDLETAQAAHAEEIKALKADFEAQQDKARSDHATASVKLTDAIEEQAGEITSLKAYIECLERDAASGDDKAAKIIAQVGGEPAGAESTATDQAELTAEQESALWAEQRSIKAPKAKRAFYLERIKPRLGN